MSAPGRQREQRRLRRFRRSDRSGSRPWGLGPRRRGLRTVGGSLPGHPPPHRWNGGSRLVGEPTATSGSMSPTDVGYSFCAHPHAHAATMSYTAAYLTGQGEAGLRGARRLRPRVVGVAPAGSRPGPLFDSSAAPGSQSLWNGAASWLAALRAAEHDRQRLNSQTTSC